MARGGELGQENGEKGVRVWARLRVGLRHAAWCHLTRPFASVQKSCWDHEEQETAPTRGQQADSQPTTRPLGAAKPHKRAGRLVPKAPVHPPQPSSLPLLQATCRNLVFLRRNYSLEEVACQ